MVDSIRLISEAWLAFNPPRYFDAVVQKTLSLVSFRPPEKKNNPSFSPTFNDKVDSLPLTSLPFLI